MGALFSPILSQYPHYGEWGLRSGSASEGRGIIQQLCLLWDGFRAIHGDHGGGLPEAWGVVTWLTSFPFPQEIITVAEVIKHLQHIRHHSTWPTPTFSFKPHNPPLRWA